MNQHPLLSAHHHQNEVQGAILYYRAGWGWAVLPPGAAGTILGVASGLPAWATLATLGLAPNTADYLVGTAQAGLSAEIVVGTAPGGELGGTWAAPTVDATHSGSTHAAAQAAAEATAQAALDAHTGDTADAHDASAISILDTANDFTATDVEGALAELQSDNEAHVVAADPHTVYRLESADHNHESTGAQAGQIDEDALATTDVTTNNATTSKHGFLLKLNNSATQFMNGQGVWATPAGGGGTAASQAEQEAGTDVTVFTSPGRQQFHPSAAKLWGKFTANSTTIEASYNITSVADTATGRMTVTIATDFSGADWCGLLSVELGDATTEKIGIDLDSAPAAGTCVLEGTDLTDGSTPFSGKDPVAWFLAGFGDQA